MEHSHGKDLEYISGKAKEVIEYIKRHNLEIRFSGEDSFRSDFTEILKLYSAVDQLGVNRVGIADTVGSATPREVFEKIDTLHKTVGCDIETHFHNDTGCAIANAYCALESGATHIDTTVLGIGERNGITPLGGLLACLMGVDRNYILSKYKIDKLGYIENLVAQAVSVEIPFNNFNISSFVETQIEEAERVGTLDSGKSLMAQAIEAELPFDPYDVTLCHKFVSCSLNRLYDMEMWCE